MSVCGKQERSGRETALVSSRISFVGDNYFAGSLSISLCIRLQIQSFVSYLFSMNFLLFKKKFSNVKVNI